MKTTLRLAIIFIMTVAAHAQLVVNVQNNLSCTTGQGTVTINASGGTPPYTISWQGSGPAATVGTPVTISTTGYYYFTVTDASIPVQTKTSSFDAFPFEVYDVVTLPSCPEWVGLSGTDYAGVPPVNCYWSNGAVTPSLHATPTMSGTVHLVFMTDGRGCKAMGNNNILITFTPYPSITGVTTTPDNGTGNGTVLLSGVNLNLSGLSYQYKRLPSGSPVVVSGPSASGLSAGNYSFTITSGPHSMECYYSSSFTIDSLRTTGIEDIEAENSIVVFPNPFVEEFTISGLPGRNVQIQIIDAVGTVVYDQWSSGNLLMKPSVANRGIYYYLVTDEENKLLKSGSLESR